METWPYKLLPDDAYDDEVTRRLEDAYHVADRASLDAQRIYRHILAGLAAASTAVAVAFLFYDAYGMVGGLLLCGVALLAEAALLRRARRLACHRIFIEQRMLAEAFRVQIYLRYAGSDLCVGDLLTWTQLVETPWLCDRVSQCVGGAPPGATHDVRASWLEGQRAYHAKAATRTERDVARSGRVVRASLAASATLYAALIAFELVLGGRADAELWRTALKFLLGGASAATVFIANFYDKLSLARVHDDHVKMERLFAWALAELDEQGQTPQLLERLAREELIENGNWYSYQLEGAPEITL